MSNKKGDSSEELIGSVVFIISVTLMLLLFGGCAKNNMARDYTQMKFSKTQIEVAEDLNRLLQVQVAWDSEEMKMSEALEKRIKAYFLLPSQPPAEQEKFKNDIKTMTSSHIPYSRRFMILTPEGGLIYDSSNTYLYNYNYLWRQMGYDDTAESVAILPVPLGQDKYEFIPVVLQSLTY